MSQQWLPGLEDWLDGRRDDRGARRRARRAPDVEKLLATTPPRVRRLFTSLRDQLLAETGIAEKVSFDDSSGSFAPAYTFRNRELLRLHLDPVLAATVTLERGETQLARLLASEQLSSKLKTHAVRCARRSGRRVFLAFLARNKDDVRDLLTVVREHVALNSRLGRADRPEPTPVG